MTNTATESLRLALERQAARQTVIGLLAVIEQPDFGRRLGQVLSADSAWHVAHPINSLTGPAAVAEGFYSRLRQALPDLERRTDILLAGHWDGRHDGGAGCWVSCIGHYAGTFTVDWLGIPATGDLATLRFGEFYRVEHGRVVEARILLDIVDLARQAGRPILPPSPGRDLLVPGPQRHDGLRLEPAEAAHGERSLALVMAMIGGLMRFDQTDLRSMGMEQYWSRRMMWYGPCGIGSVRGVSGFQRHHQRPFLHAFPDRVGGNHRARFAEGDFVASTGWPSVRATHRGDYLGVPASNTPIDMRVMDWWRCEDGLLVENWVLIDLPHLMLQMGVDLLARVQR